MGKPKKLKEVKSEPVEKLVDSVMEADKAKTAASVFETRDPSAINADYSALCSRLGDLLLAKDRLDADMQAIKNRVNELAVEMGKANAERAGK